MDEEQKPQDQKTMLDEYDDVNDNGDYNFKQNEIILNPAKEADEGFDFLLHDGVWQQIEQALEQDQSIMYFLRLGKIFNYISNFLSISFIQEDLMKEFIPSIQEAFKLFIEQVYISEHVLTKDKSSLILLQFDKSLVETLINELCFPSQQNWFLIFVCNAPSPFLTQISLSEIQYYVLQRMEQAFQDQIFDSYYMDIVAYIFLIEPNRHIHSIMNIVQVLLAFLESFLQIEDNTSKVQVQNYILNILRLFVLLTENDQVREYLFNSNLHLQLYETIKLTMPVFSQLSSQKIFDQPIIKQALTTLICRIATYQPLEQRLVQILSKDIFNLINNSSYHFIIQVILPILNLESSRNQYVCFHNKGTQKELLRKYKDYFKKNISSQNQSNTQLPQQDQQVQDSPYEQMIQDYWSQMRLEPVILISEDATLEWINEELSRMSSVQLMTEENPKKTLKQLSGGRSIVDLHVNGEFQLAINKFKKQQRPILQQFYQQIGGLVNIGKRINSVLCESNNIQQLKYFFNDFMELIEIEGFNEQLMKQEGFLQTMIGLVFHRNSNQLGYYFHDGIFNLYQALNNLILTKVHFQQVFKLLVQKCKLYLGNLYKDTNDIVMQQNSPDNRDDNLRLLFQGQKQQKEIKGKPKGIGYGDISYNNKQFQKSPSEIHLSPEKLPLTKIELFSSQYAQKYSDRCISVMLNCLKMILKDLQVSESIRSQIMNSKLFAILKTIFHHQSISEIIQRGEVTIPALQLIREISKNEELLDLFVKQQDDHSPLIESNTLYRMLENQREQALIYQSSFKHPQNDGFIPLFLSTIEYLEQRLVAAEFIYLSYEQEKSVSDITTTSRHQLYPVLMKPLAVGRVALLREDKDWLGKMGTLFTQQSSTPPQIKMNRLVQELADLANSLPLEATNSIFLRFDSDRMDVMRAIICGSSGTPYAHGAFQYELLFKDDYPNRPPYVQLQTTGHGKFRFNPNLYSCGKVCLSLLGTWGDNWITNISTILQILVSIQSIVMSEYVMFNEPGWENQMGTPEGEKKNLGYCNLVRINNIRYAMIEQLQNPPLGFEDVIRQSFHLRSELICKEVEEWISQADQPANYTQTQNQSTYQATPQQYKIDLCSLYEELKVELQNVKRLIGSRCSREFQMVQRKTHISTNKQQIHRYPIIQRELLLPTSLPLNNIDTSYQQVIHKPFNPSDPNVQNLMSRYIGVLGVDAVQKQSEASVLLLGLGALGIEVAKNIVLSGIKRLTVWDQRTTRECGQFFMWDEDVGKSRAIASLGRLQHLNPYVKVEYMEGSDILQSLQQCISSYSMVVVADDAFTSVLEISRLCRSNNISIVLAQSNGVYGRVVTDFGSGEVSDRDGEPTREYNIESISSEGDVVLFKSQTHTLQDGDRVILREVVESEGGDGLHSLNNTEFVIRGCCRGSFNIGDLQGHRRFIRNGIVFQQKRKAQFKHLPMEEVLFSQNHDENMSMVFESPDLIKRNLISHLFTYSLRYQFQSQIGWDPDEAIKFFYFIKEQLPHEQLHLIFNHEIVTRILLFSFLRTSSFPSLQAFLGGIVAQEVIKAITQKYTPINQILVHSVEEILPFKITDISQLIFFDPQTNLISMNQEFTQFVISHGFLSDCSPRYRDFQAVVGAHALQRIHQSKIFMVGAGAIGCELLKNFAVVGAGSLGCVYLTDPDVIENSNLSRQFLFREKHIRQPKAVTAAAVALQMNPNLQIVARMDRICEESYDIYPMSFFAQMDCVANALDNVQARRYVDSRCLQASVPLVESGTLGPKGHVQVITPNVTESYASKQDPDDENDIPYCTLRMFPENAIHCLEWARDKFEQYFVRRPQAIMQALVASQQPDPQSAMSKIQQQTLELALRCLQRLPKNFDDCIWQARLKYERMFRWGIDTLLLAYPLNSCDGQGRLFWQSPKRPPHNLDFNEEGWQAIQFAHDYAILLAKAYSISIPEFDLMNYVRNVSCAIVVPEFQIPKEKLNQMKQQVEKQAGHIEQDQQSSKQHKSIEEVIRELQEIILKRQPEVPLPQHFEKDNDSNHHVSLITSATNARAKNYSIQSVDWLWCKLKAGRIVPAMSTTTSCVSALQSIEIFKSILKSGGMRNSFMNLAVPFFMQSEPGACEQIEMNSTLKFNIWSKHLMPITQITSPLIHFIIRIEHELQCRVTALKQGARAIYIAQMVPQDPIEKEKMLLTPILKLIECNEGFIDLEVSLLLGAREVQGPKLRLIL